MAWSLDDTNNSWAFNLKLGQEVYDLSDPLYDIANVTYAMVRGIEGVERDTITLNGPTTFVSTGIFNVGIMGFTALGGLAAVLISYSPVGEAWRVGGLGMAISLFLLISLVIIVYYINAY